MCAAERKHNNENESGNEQKLFDIGKYRFEWHCDVSNEDKVSITVIETLSRDRFESRYSLQDLKSMKFFKPNVIDVKHFIEKILFNNDPNNHDMFSQIGFIDKDNQCEGYKSLKTDKYTESDKLVILLHYVNEWINSKWELELDPVPQTEDVKVLEIVRDLQYQNRKIKQEIKDLKSINTSIPKGTIVMWSGDLQNIPEGYLLCDGSNDTPDLRDRFVLGCSYETKIGSKGGNDTHSHNVTVSGRKLQIKHMPPHQHKMKRDYWDIQSGGGGNKYRVLCANNNGDRDLWSNYVGSGEEHDHPSYCAKSSNIPPYVSLAFIMKT
mmetsp:Transcript_29656/g.26224  ORF Transcript_29656/g.26224 Transcript_29656/m.26224 type:complete len:323 (+) Transcript_29656:154-1122(+)|eukprot:CAMPEP_0201581616 /NCGR_PEP_ID=MMETSP0190_2-20130828/72200_1 /ASSEMBLY_ACC=CAM_ASM_000263 /TAXON_ID=37353 /ORGANISM="Rosalina sp." /LENGTH=322 /DNA_ID=CAMNT_0048019951 /DNA_START=145 /DNA_END=1113 /DNA_ORIENTATION=-